jgi:hypothetical protein
MSFLLVFLPRVTPMGANIRANALELGAVLA